MNVNETLKTFNVTPTVELDSCYDTHPTWECLYSWEPGLPELIEAGRVSKEGGNKEQALRNVRRYHEVDDEYWSYAEYYAERVIELLTEGRIGMLNDLISELRESHCGIKPEWKLPFREWEEAERSYANAKEKAYIAAAAYAENEGSLADYRKAKLELEAKLVWLIEAQANYAKWEAENNE